MVVDTAPLLKRMVFGRLVMAYGNYAILPAEAESLSVARCLHHIGRVRRVLVATHNFGINPVRALSCPCESSEVQVRLLSLKHLLLTSNCICLHAHRAWAWPHAKISVIKMGTRYRRVQKQKGFFVFPVIPRMHTAQTSSACCRPRDLKDVMYLLFLTEGFSCWYFTWFSAGPWHRSQSIPYQWYFLSRFSLTDNAPDCTSSLLI